MFVVVYVNILDVFKLDLHFLNNCTWFCRRCLSLFESDSCDALNVVPMLAFDGLVAQVHDERQQFLLELIQVHKELFGHLLDGQFLAGLLGRSQEVRADLLALGEHLLELALHAFLLQVFEFVHLQALGLELVLLLDLAPQFHLRAELVSCLLNVACGRHALVELKELATVFKDI